MGHVTTPPTRRHSRLSRQRSPTQRPQSQRQERHVPRLMSVHPHSPSLHSPTNAHTLVQQFPSLFRIFCTNYVSAPVSTVNDLIAFNSANASRAMPPPHTDQTDLIATTESKLSAHEADELLSQARTRASESIDAALNDHGIDVIIGPGDCPLCTVAALAGYPTAMVPLGVLESEEGMGQPQGLMVIAGKDGEGAMLRFMKLWEQDVVGRAKVPVLLREAGEGLGS